jgi:hypothetical protein
MTKKSKTPPAPSRGRVLLAALLLVVGIFAALKTLIGYVATGTLSGYWVVAALLGLALGGQTLRQLMPKR